MVVTKRVYDDYAKQDGFRILVDRLWPRGVTKDAAKVDTWLKEVAPSTELRKWFHKDRNNYKEFVKKYKEELRTNNALPQLKELIKAHQKVTLLYGAKDEENNHAEILRQLVSKG